MKQRLIDANALMRLLPSEEMVSKYSVANAPTVKAIPIDWIEKQIKTVCDNIEAETFGKWLIKEWEKENEENIHA